MRTGLLSICLRVARYRKLTDIFAVESDIAKTIADTLQARLTGSEKQMIASQSTSDTTAYELYHRGKSFWERRSGDNMPKAISFYEEAIARDPSYALACAGLANAYALLPYYTSTAQRDAFPQAEEAALKALPLDPSLPEAHAALGKMLFFHEIHLAGAIREYQRAMLSAAARAQAGDAGAALRLLTDLDNMSQQGEVLAYWRALLYLSLNNKEQAIHWLEQSFADRDGGNIGWIKVDPLLDLLRGDPRFEALVQKVVSPKTPQ